MRLAWFRAIALSDASPLDPTAALIAELQATHNLEVFSQRNAHDFVWKAFRTPYDVCVFELDNTPSHAFVWPYLLQYGGVVFLHTLTLHDARAHALVRQGRRDDYTAEFAFSEGYPPPSTGAAPVREGTWPMLRVPLMASRLAVLAHRGMAAVVQEQYPLARVVSAPPGVRDAPARAPQRSSVTTFGVLTGDRVDVVRRAVTRARESGAVASLLVNDSPDLLLQNADVIVTLTWPSFGEPQMFALAAMAAGTPVIVLETEYTTDWPALDPQTWQPRGLQREPPIVVSLDVRDEEHSLTVAIRRLSADEALRRRIGDAAESWWRAQATVGHAAGAWQRLLSDAAALQPPPRPAGWPPHLNADGTERARTMLVEFGVDVDLL